MATTTMHTYEAMFLIDSGQENFEAACEPINRVLERNNAEVLATKLWEERRLAYEIKGRRRGTYVLVYFKMDPAEVVELENDAKLDEKILRVLILRNEDVTDEVLKAETPATNPRREEEGDSRRRGGRRGEDSDSRNESKSQADDKADDKAEDKAEVKAEDQAKDKDSGDEDKEDSDDSEDSSDSDDSDKDGGQDEDSDDK